ncbi:MAG: prepilin-type N-terminal cleavage/methylation domain-containing protein, partial [Candidatus Gracilibacteria bacterium]|nr:prepilin-type N-terminal cleavage/methylation domain-containing protein [Candidatus Gracilibacteria bacterium]
MNIQKKNPSQFSPGKGKNIIAPLPAKDWTRIKWDVRRIGGFTLVELIVVITILAILGTIAFVSLQGYSSNARDSVRTSDLSRMKSTLELYNLDAGNYPQPSEVTVITYSG